MKLSERTIEILRNFSEINPSVFIKTGNEMRTLEPGFSSYVKANVEETFPTNIYIYDLPSLLGVISIFTEPPELDFQEQLVEIQGVGGKYKTRFKYASSERMDETLYDKNLALKNADFTFSLPADDLNMFLKISRVLNSPQIVIRSDGKKYFLDAIDRTNSGAPTNTVELGENTTGKTLNAILKSEELHLLPDNYQVSIDASMKIVNFSNNKDINYFNLLDPDLTYGD